MDSAKIEHLLKNYRIADVIQIQKGLKNDVEKKKSDLKSLIGERYNELLEATDSVVHMTHTVDKLIDSLKSLDGLVTSAVTDSKVIDIKRSGIGKDYADYCDLLLVKRILDLPFKIWDNLESTDVCLATFHYFYGLNLYSTLHQEKSQLLNVNNNLLRFNQMKLTSLNVYIVEKCWVTLSKKLGEYEIDYNYFSDAFSCIILLTPCNISQLILEFYHRQGANVVELFKEKNKLSVLFERFLNAIINSIRCSKIFEIPEESDQQAMIESRFESIIVKTYCRYSPTEPSYRIADDIDRSKCLVRENKLTIEFLQQWLTTVKSVISPIFIEKLNTTNSIREVFDEIVSTDLKINEDSRFSEWRIGGNIDVCQTIWKEAILNLFEARVLEISNQSITSIEQALLTTLRSNEQFLQDCDMNIVESIWSTSEVKTSNNQFLKLVDMSCQVIDDHFFRVKEEVCILKTNFQNALVAICSNIDKMFTNSFRSIFDSCSLEKFRLFAAILFKTIPIKCENAQAIFELQTTSDKDAISWETVQTKMGSISDHYFCKWFESVIESHLAKLELAQFTELNRFLENLSTWESVPLNLEEKENGREDEQKVTSTMDVPTQISLSIYHLLDSICRDINRYCAYSLPQAVLIHILSILGTKLFDFYTQSIETIQGKALPKGAKQTIAIQFYFDLSFLKLFYTSSKDENLRKNYVARANELATRLETFIDPFDLHIIYPIIQTNAERLFQSSGIIFGFLIVHRFESSVSKTFSKASTASTSTSGATYRHNIMLLHSN